MTTEEIKNRLSKLYGCKEDFTVIMSGKVSNRVNGLYKSATHEIILHNRNFKNDNQLMYTAVHEFTHHVLTTEEGGKATKAHSGAFKALVKLQKQLVTVLNKLQEVCDEEGERIEDVIESDLQMSRNKAKELRRMAVSNSEFSDEMTKTICSAKDVMLATKAAEEGKTVEQVRAIAKKTKPVDDDLESPEQLRREKKRLESTIERLNDRLVQVEETLASMGE